MKNYWVSPKTEFKLHTVPKRIYLGTDYTDEHGFSAMINYVKQPCSSV